MNTNNMYNIRNIYEYCGSLSILEFTRDFRSSKVKYMNKQFCVYKSLSKLNLSSFNNSDVANTSYVFFVIVTVLLLILS